MRPLLLLLWLLLALGLAGAALVLGRYHGFGPRGTDDQYYYAQARSLLVDRDLDLRNELGTLTPRPENVHTSTSIPWDQPTATGKIGCKYPIGAPLLQLPFLLVGLGVADGLGREEGVAPGYEDPAYLAWTAGNALYALLAVLLLSRWLGGRFGLGSVPAFLAAASALVGGPLLYHTVGDPFMAHVPSAFLVSLLVWAAAAPRADANTASLTRCLLLGAILGLAMGTRLTNLVFAAVLVPVLAPLRPGAVGRALLLGAGVLVGFAPQMLAWKYLYGDWLVRPYPQETFDFLRPEVWGNLFGVRAGLFFWAPLWGLGTAAALARLRVAPWLWVASLGLAVFNWSWWCWWWGDTYGGRAFAALLPLVALGLAVLFGARSAAARRLALALAVLGAAWSGAMIYRMEKMLPSERAEGRLLP